MNNRLDNPRFNIPCQAKACKSNMHGFCQGIPKITVEEREIVPYVDVYCRGPRAREVMEIWGCAEYKRRES